MKIATPNWLESSESARSYVSLPAPRAAISGSMKVSVVRYSAVKTKVRMTELNGCVAQSHSAHDMTCLRGTTLPSCRSSPTAATAPVSAMTGTVLDVVSTASSAGCSGMRLR